MSNRPMSFWEFLNENIFWILWVALIGFFMFLDYKEYSRKPVHRVNNPAPLSDAQLQRWYDGTNEEYFANELPKNVEVKWGDLTEKGDMGYSVIRADESWLITIDRKTNPTNGQAELTEMHEICHVYLYSKGDAEFNSHGDKFQACMLRLANQGAFKGLW